MTLGMDLTPNEDRLLRRLCDGETLLEISVAMGKSPNYASTAISRARYRLKIKTTEQLVAWFVRSQRE